MGWKKVTITDLEAGRSPEIMLRGLEYHQNGHVLRACRFDSLIAGEVAGTGGNYRTQLILEDHKIDGSCSCPYPGFCKHMVALGLAWIEKSVEFFNLESIFHEVADNPEQLKDLMIRLIRKDPLNFLELNNAAIPKEEFLNSRGILNLIRNTFQGPLLTTSQIESQWDRIERVGEMVSKAVVKGEKGALRLWGALLKGISDSYRAYPATPLKKVFLDQLQLLKDLPQEWTDEEAAISMEALWENYFDCLWELAELIRPVLVDFYEINPKWFLGKLRTDDWWNLERPKIMLLYEFLALTAKKDPVMAEYFEKVVEILGESSEGRLWLLDRALEEDADQAYLMAKEGLRTSNKEDKQSFRERLIEVHRQRGERKQAASLSFIQFQEKPNLEEYLRLKEILTDNRKEFHTYLKKMDQVIEDNGLGELALEIAFDRGDWIKLEEKLAKIQPELSFLKELAKLVMTTNQVIPKEIFQVVISRLLAGGRGDWETALGLLVFYKKTCLNNCRSEEWECFRAVLNTEYGENLKFNRKFGTVLAG
ncbi:MAG: hypothetical protein GXY86_12405 [Firmicutes bacterium]|nr:hypothetical protein [Bacillota bacterium]